MQRRIVLGWHKADAPMNRFWDSMNQFAVTEAEIKAVKIPVQTVVGDRDHCKRWYVEPLQKVRPDWPVHLIADAGHLNCIAKPDFKTQLDAALK